MKYQKIKFGDIDIEGVDRYPDVKKIFKGGIENKTLLDIGCNIGYYCFEAAFRGAQYCLGVDNHSVFIDDANRIKLDLHIENVGFVLMDLFDLKVESIFDYVLCLNLLHVLPTIEHIERCFDICDKFSSEKMVFSVLPPSNKKDLISIEPNVRGVEKIHISRNYVKERFPKYKIRSYKSAVTEGRVIVEVQK